MKRDKSFGLDSVGSRLLNPAPSPRSRRSSPSPQVLLYAQNKAPRWLIASDRNHRPAWSPASSRFVMCKTAAYIREQHLSARLTLTAFTHTAALQTSHSRAQALKKKKVPFSPWVVCFSSFYMSLSEALLYKTDSYFRALNIFHTWLRGVFPPPTPPHTHSQCVEPCTPFFMSSLCGLSSACVCEGGGYGFFKSRKTGCTA